MSEEPATYHDVYYEVGSYKLTFYDSTDTKCDSMKMDSTIVEATARANDELARKPESYSSYTIERMIVNTLQTPWSNVNAATKPSTN